MLLLLILLRKSVEVLPGKCWKIGKKKDLIIGNKLKRITGEIKNRSFILI